MSSHAHTTAQPMEFQLAESGRTDDLRRFLQQNRNNAQRILSAYSPVTQGTVLYHAVLSGEVQCCRMLIDEFRVDVQQPSTQYGNTPLHLAVLHGYSEIARMLLDRGATIRTNTFGEFPADQLEKPSPCRTPGAALATIDVLRQYRGAAQKATTGSNIAYPSNAAVPPRSSSAAAAAPGNNNLAPQQQQQLPSPTALLPGSPLPPQCDEVRRVYPETRLAWFESNADYIAKGLLPYNYKGRTYYTPVILLCSKNIPANSNDASVYRAMVDLSNLNGLSLSQRAQYVDPVSGTIHPQPPFRWTTFYMFIKDVVLPLFEKIPPLVDSTSSTAIPSGRAAAVSIERRIALELSAFHDGALEFRPMSNTVEGVIPIYPNNSRAFNMLAAIPIKITLLHLTHGHAKDAPLVFIGQRDADMALQTTKYVNGQSGQVTGLLALSTWTANSSLTGLLVELQQAFTTQLPIISNQGRSQTSPLAQSDPGCSTSPVTPPTAASPGGPPNKPISTPSTPAPPASTTSSDDARLCVICMCNEKKYIALPCRHLLFCSDCVQAFARQAKKDCPVCRTEIKDLFEIYT